MHSNAKYYSADSEDGHVPDLRGHDWDEVGLIWAITVKAHSSSQQKELFKTIQIKNKAESQQEEVNSFEEWTCVCLFNNLLQDADEAQHAFSAATWPTLHNVLPAIEKLYTEWQKAYDKPCYALFKEALEVVMTKLDEYYKKTAISDAHVIAMGSGLPKLKPEPAEAAAF
ncbi:hypothetical protein CPB84DRAFT_1852094 [Gymnopilus junonius]|uniref:Uncharacterized protein n=1 Tax=Gymnopilus junonius TaxID=109634 RepID=A0A9P5TGU9_GYMJU|nr:hypothetical protein CPB84DRAFT_1852094 [Gymnopilus junonius]